MAEVGAFAFGVVIGWFTYFTNRYRTGPVQFSDITTLAGVIGGGAVTALFGDGGSALFGAYGIGLAFGFFAYFAVLVLMVVRSDGVFTWTWFLDGRRKALKDDETTDGTRGSGTAMDIRFPVAAAEASTGGVDDARTLREQVEESAFRALRDLARRIGGAEDDVVRARLLQMQMRLTTSLNELVGLRPEQVTEAALSADASAELRTLAGDLSAAAMDVRSSSDASAATGALLDRLERIVARLKTTTA
jgi:hypothetical protein